MTQTLDIAVRGQRNWPADAHQMSGEWTRAVVVFFLLSGWLVGGSLLNKATREGAFKDYAIDRMTRLWIVLMPTFILILGLGILAARIDPRIVSLAIDDELGRPLIGQLQRPHRDHLSRR